MNSALTTDSAASMPREFTGNTMDEMARWLMVSGARAAFLMLLGPACNFDYYHAMCSGASQAWIRGQERFPSVGFWTIDCQGPLGNSGKLICDQALDRAPGVNEEPLYMEWIGGGNWMPMARGMPPPDYELFGRVQTAVDRGNSDQFEADVLATHADKAGTIARAWEVRRLHEEGVKQGRLPARAVAPVILPVYWSLGLNNYKMEIRRSMLMAKVSKRPLCLPPFTDGGTYAPLDPSKHWGTPISGMYDLDELSTFLSIAPPEACPPSSSCMPLFTLCGRAENKTLADISVSAGQYRTIVERAIDGETCASPYRCGVALITPHALYYDLWRSLRKPPVVVAAAERTLHQLFGSGSSSHDVDDNSHPLFFALHWRFEEDVCPKAGYRSGLCVWTMDGPKPMSLEQLRLAVSKACAARGLTNVFIATDGRFRNGDALIDELLEMLKEDGLNPKELGDCEDCVAKEDMAAVGLKESTYVSELEQQMVAFASYALGSSRSSWYFEALFDMASRARDVVAFEVIHETEEALHGMSADLHRNLNVPFPSLGTMEGLPFGFLVETHDPSADTTCGAIGQEECVVSLLEDGYADPSIPKKKKKTRKRRVAPATDDYEEDDDERYSSAGSKKKKKRARKQRKRRPDYDDSDISDDY